MALSSQSSSVPTPINIYGGTGGGGGAGGTWGGGGGLGEGPTLNIGATTMHLMIQNRWDDSDTRRQRPVGCGPSERSNLLRLPGVTTARAARYPPYELPSRRHMDLNQNAAPFMSSSSHGGTYITAQTLNHLGEPVINTLHRAVALEALYDSADSFPQPRCNPDTRAETLDALYNWAIGPNSGYPLCWLHGPAGAGKSAIMQTLCQKFNTAGHLGGAFFFKRGHMTRGNARALFTTLAYQLVLNNEDLHTAILQNLEQDRTIVGRNMDVQLRQLIDEPSQLLTNCPPLVLLIDGLDECQDEKVQQEIIGLLGRTITAHRRSYPFRFLIASRPEMHIRELFYNLSFEGIVGSINVEQSFEDVRTYFRQEFARIHREHRTMANVSAPWPPQAILDSLVKKSSGYFAYAATVIRFIDDKHYRPTERLDMVRNLASNESDAPFAELDQLYIHILSAVPTRFLSKLRDILQCTVVSNLQLSPAQIDHLFEWEAGEVQLTLRALHSVLDIPSDFALISVHHASFSDFLQDQRRSSVFHVDLGNCKNVAYAVFKAFSNEYGWHEYRMRRPTGSDFIKCITAIPPSSELLPLFEGLRIDLIWGPAFLSHYAGEINRALFWLKAIHPVPKKLVRRWEEYTTIWGMGVVPPRSQTLLDDGTT
ncbi:hypothetical protein C8R45DRAFT_990946 [Mycena sanguinolenta]|nr:hypothetical protein C8R45DRAFT_990946 [Mycena sanguinolenta]